MAESVYRGHVMTKPTAVPTTWQGCKHSAVETSGQDSYLSIDSACVFPCPGREMWEYALLTMYMVFNMLIQIRCRYTDCHAQISCTHHVVHSPTCISFLATPRLMYPAMLARSTIPMTATHPVRLDTQPRKSFLVSMLGGLTTFFGSVKS